MRITGGEMGGRHLYAPEGRNTRPTSDKVKEALFSILGGRLNGEPVLDLFAGSGALGLEALSRGAGDVYLVDSARSAASVIRRNIELLHCEQHAHIICADWRVALGTLRGHKFGLALIDPPYAQAELYSEPLHALTAADLLAKHAVIVLEHSTGFTPNYSEDCFKLKSVHRYGDTALTLLACRDGRDIDI